MCWIRTLGTPTVTPYPLNRVVQRKCPRADANPQRESRLTSRPHRPSLYPPHSLRRKPKDIVGQQLSSSGPTNRHSDGMAACHWSSHSRARKRFRTMIGSCRFSVDLEQVAWRPCVLTSVLCVDDGRKLGQMRWCKKATWSWLLCRVVGSGGGQGVDSGALERWAIASGPGRCNRFPGSGACGGRRIIGQEGSRLDVCNVELWPLQTMRQVLGQLRHTTHSRRHTRS